MVDQKREKWRTFIRTLNPSIDPDSVRLLEQFLQVFHGMHRIGENSLASSGLSFAKYRLLLGLMFSETIEDRKDLNPSEISRRQGTSRNTISALIRDLEQERLIERQLDSEDRRRFNIKLTESGRNFVINHASDHFQAIAICFRGLNDPEKRELSGLLFRLAEGMMDEVP